VTIAAAILAAGGSRRLGQPKQLLAIDGTTLVETVVARVCASRCDRFAIVVGAHAADVIARVARHPVDIVANPHWQEGLASSVRAAAAWAQRIAASGLLLCVVDQPRLATEHLDRLVERFRASRTAVGSRYAGTLGVPAIVPATAFAELIALTGDRGARALLARPGTIAIDWADGAIDIDVAADLAHASG
jgi:CTP:molybdopterin cytidylyltransferase MocA